MPGAGINGGAAAPSSHEHANATRGEKPRAVNGQAGRAAGPAGREARRTRSDWQRPRVRSKSHTIKKMASATKTVSGRITILDGDVPLYLLLLRYCDEASTLYLRTTSPWLSSEFS
jgi:hypothetical protein